MCAFICTNDWHFSMTGSIYGNVVRQCLAIKTSERTEAEVRELSKFCSDISASLDQCRA
jgi:citrate lyase synthetase